MAAAGVFVVVLGLLTVFQLGLACGAPWGRLAWGGRHRVLPPRLRIASAVAPALYALFAVVILDRSGSIDALAEPVALVGAWIVFACFTLSVVGNALSRSTPERYTGTPLGLVLAFTSLLVALG
ncbi:hypothetical protein [Nocardia mexicana]|uniref:DoxX-like protein n=1 Tax=Nocardia mexicana TaxID=279262 RepID=A0A370HEI1_9NOCA|nr:hypothetical protein [Nocardia mexicana]RDI55641.1 hypothetical protein DFR68_101475 [Nocardia mexicana]